MADPALLWEDVRLRHGCMNVSAEHRTEPTALQGDEHLRCCRTSMGACLVLGQGAQPGDEHPAGWHTGGGVDQTAAEPVLGRGVALLPCQTTPLNTVLGCELVSDDTGSAVLHASPGGHKAVPIALPLVSSPSDAGSAGMQTCANGSLPTENTPGSAPVRTCCCDGMQHAPRELSSGSMDEFTALITDRQWRLASRD